MAEALYATNRWPCDGTTTKRTFSFSGGYIDKAHVRAFIEDAATRVRLSEVTITEGMWADAYTLTGLPAGAAGQNHLILRETPKDLPLVDFINRSRMTEANLDKIARQAVFSAAETADATNADVLAKILNYAAAVTALAAAADADAASALASKIAAAASGLAAANSAATASTKAGEASASAATATTKAGEAAASAVTAANGAAVVTAAQPSLDTVATNIVAVQTVAAAVPELTTKVSKTSNTGSAVLPVGTTAERDAVPQKGYLRFNDTLGKPEVYSGTAWGSVGGGATGGGSDSVFQENSTVVTENYTVPVGKNAMTVGPLSINTGKSITVSSGQRLVVL